MSARQCLRLFVLLPLVLLAGIGPAREAVAEGTYEEIEARLKSAGIEPGLRERIHRAIRKGARWLIDLDAAAFRHRPDAAPLIHLALAHTGLPEALRAVKAHRSVWSNRQFEKQTYTAGLLGMLYQVVDGQDPAVARIHKALAKGPTRSHGSWGYQPHGGGGNNLSTAQFAALGMWGCERTGRPPATKAWMRHLEACLDNQGPLGSFDYAWSRKPAASGYPNGTSMGLANLVLAEAALKDQLTQDPGLRAHALLARHAARAALRRHAAWILHPSGHGLRVGYPYYSLWALEKAATFLGVETVGGIRWYREGARLLVETQAEDGGWFVPPATAVHMRSRQNLPGLEDPWWAGFGTARSVIYTSFALLFLLRATDVYRPITPRQAPRPQVITGAPAPRATPEDTGPVGPPKPVVDRVLADLARRTQRAGREDLAPGLRDLDLLGRALHAFAHAPPAPGSPEHRLRTHIEDALVDAATPVVAARPALPSTIRVALAVEALETLRRATPRAGKRLLEALAPLLLRRRLSERLGLAWYGAWCDVVRVLRPEGFLGFWLDLLPDVPTRDHDTWVLPLLTGLRSLGDLPARERVRVALRVSAWVRSNGKRSSTFPFHMDALHVMDAVLPPSDDGARPAARFEAPAESLAELHGWLRKHRDPAKAPW